MSVSETGTVPGRDYPRSEFSYATDGVFEHGAALDAWRTFLTEDRLLILQGNPCSLSIVKYAESNGVVEFSSKVSVIDASETIQRLLFQKRQEPGLFVRPIVFVRRALQDPRAWLRLPLSEFVSCDPRKVPFIEFSIHQHWQVRMENFSFGKKQEKYKKYDTVLFTHPLSKAINQSVEVECREIDALPPKDRREALLRKLEEHAVEYRFSILERQVVRRLNGDPDPFELIQ